MDLHHLNLSPTQAFLAKKDLLLVFFEEIPPENAWDSLFDLDPEGGDEHCTGWELESFGFKIHPIYRNMSLFAIRYTLVQSCNWLNYVLVFV